MKIHPSPLNCLDYYVTACSLTANPKYTLGEANGLNFDDLNIQTHSELIGDFTSPENWRVSLEVGYNPGPEKNAPYSFTIGLIGTFTVRRDYPANKVKTLVEVNGSSMLYSIARQILASMMHNGPHQAILLPTVSFADVKPPQPKKTDADAPPASPANQ